MNSSSANVNPISDSARKKLSAAEARDLVESLIQKSGDVSQFSANRILESNPDLKLYPSCVIDLAYEEYCRRRELGREFAPTQFVRQFEGYEQSLYRIIEFDQVVHDHPSLIEDIPEERWPRVGHEFCRFRLIEEIGRGALSRVFLAQQADLRDRHVIVKVCIRSQREAGLMASIEHPGIAGIYSIHLDESVGLGAICMPFLTRVTLHHLTESLHRTLPPRRLRQITAGRLKTIVDELNEAAAALPVPFSSPTSDTESTSGESEAESDTSHSVPQPTTAVPGPRTVPGGKSTGETEFKGKAPLALVALTWGIDLAKALQHAHAHGVMHCDLKPGNVLVLPDLTVQLLDFNLATSVDDALRLAGGTPPYMAPEQLRLLIESLRIPVEPASRHSADVSDAPSTEPAQPASTLSSATDVFGLCATIWHFATGEPPFGVAVDCGGRIEAAELLLSRQLAGIDPVQLHRIREVLPGSVVSILLRGLTFDQNRRIQTPEELTSRLQAARRKYIRRQSWIRRATLTAATLAGLAAVSLTGPAFSTSSSKTSSIGAGPVVARVDQDQRRMEEIQQAVRGGQYETATSLARQLPEAAFQRKLAELAIETSMLPTLTLEVPQISGRSESGVETYENPEILRQWQQNVNDWEHLCESPGAPPEAWWNLAFVHLELGSVESAASAFERATVVGCSKDEADFARIFMEITLHQELGRKTDQTQLNQLLEMYPVLQTRGQFLCSLILHEAEIQPRNLHNDPEGEMSGLLDFAVSQIGINVEPGVLQYLVRNFYFFKQSQLRRRLETIRSKKYPAVEHHFNRIVLLPTAHTP
ncbi:MAG: serine/threonine protein kinase [Planctomycetaceae bacterium]|nr:serine/threonine protein kinase [Planctomycetaceae bacterium]